jgi:hypothetical protein
VGDNPVAATVEEAEQAVAKGHRQALCRICKKRPPWRGKNCPPGVCKRCYHKHVWPDVRAARGEAPPTEAQPMVYDGYYGRFVPVEAASFDVATTPEAIVEMPIEADLPERRPRSGPRRRAQRRRRTS